MPGNVLAQCLTLDFLGNLGSSGNNRPSNTPASRDDGWDFRWGMERLTPLNSDPGLFAPIGVKLGLYKAVDRDQNWMLGGNFGVGRYGGEGDDVNLAGYERFSVSQNYVEFNAQVIYRWLNAGIFHAYVGAFAGILSISTNGSLVSEETRHNFWLCTEAHVREDLGGFNTVRPNIGFIFGVQVPFRNDYDKFFMEASYRGLGPTEYVANDDFDLVDTPGGDLPIRLDFQTQTSVLQLLSPRIGFSHAF
ncbi:MAG: hypothetical protein AAGB22_11210, partial [Bacteroidota bacterium]